MGGEWDRIEGTAKDLQGEVTGDKSTEAEGNLQEARGEGKDKWDEVTDSAEERLGEGREEFRERL